MAESRFVATESLRVHLLEAGQDQPGVDPVILLHGFPQTSHMWRHQIPVLAEQYKIYAPDTRGFGDTEKPRVRLNRDIQARDIIELLDALEIEKAQLIGHDWGGVIAAAAALKHPDRFSKLGLIDTLVSVWITWGIHGYWFKCEPDAEEFYEKHHRAFIRSIFAGEEAPYGGPPESPWRGVEGSEGHEALSDFDPTRFWTPEDVAHYEEKFADPGVWFHAIEYYRHCLPFHIERDDPSSTTGKSYEFLSSPKVAEMWKHPGLIFSHPQWAENFMVYAPEDRHRSYPGPTLYLFSPFLMPQAFENGELPPDDVVSVVSTKAFRDRIADHGITSPQEECERAHRPRHGAFGNVARRV